MTTKSVVQDFSSDTSRGPNPSPISVKLETPATLRPPQPPANSDVHIVHVPSYSRWFSWDHIHHCEVQFLPEFFDSHSPSKNPRLYMYYRNNIIKHYRDNPARKLTFTDARKTLVGDVGSIRRVFDFLEVWGLINYSSSALNKPLRWEDKDSKAASPVAESPTSCPEDSSTPNKESPKKRVCHGCKSLCSIACFVSEKYDMTLCARCYVRGNYQIGVTSSDFRRVEINEEMRSDWAYKDTLHLLEALMHYGDDWRKVAQHVGRSEKECITHFIKIPFGEEFIADFDSGNFDYKNTSPLKDSVDSKFGMESNGTPSPSKRMRLTPLADASNPIMAQAAFLSALAGIEVAKAAACAAVTTLCEADYETSRLSLGSRAWNARQHEVNAESNGDTNLDELGGAFVDANSQLEKEGMDVERAISGITEVQMKEIQEKIVRFEELDLQMEKERQKLEQMKNMLFVDKLTLSIHKTCAQRTEGKEKNIQTD
ncbi:PREDICTED: SWI/SNF [Prunus dulcis]|uniref:PREDICTED: SWI/SNF n=1 Tax=Prunus dulcis TaxID=3755 RepID=A0A5E4F5P2_PRUDU|nr:SWI/SNF complex subunit SWI3B [Prunus dulcis]XP_034216616.1 SWI/SNF complex subunit SWI3B [Prunus dulcis]VVA23186.1 PREDICTED: SWI/SNF [Prunus dulcis]